MQPQAGDIRQFYLQGLAGVVNSPQFMNGDEPGQRNMVGTFIYPYINLLLKQIPANQATQ